MPFKRVYVSKKTQYTPSSCNEEVRIVPPKWQIDRFLTKPIFFWKPNEPYGYFCQWYQSNMTDENGQIFNCCEQYMMWHKAKAFGDSITMSAVLKEINPINQKALGKQVQGFHDDEWDEIKYDVVLHGNMLKFSQCMARDDDTFVYPSEYRERDVTLKHLLLATDSRELAEASRFDKVWGIGKSAADAENTAREEWGENLLGKALMAVRKQLQDKRE